MQGTDFVKMPDEVATTGKAATSRFVVFAVAFAFLLGNLVQYFFAPFSAGPVAVVEDYATAMVANAQECTPGGPWDYSTDSPNYNYDPHTWPCMSQCQGSCGTNGCYYCYDDRSDINGTYNATLSAGCGQCCDYPGVPTCGPRVPECPADGPWDDSTDEPNPNFDPFIWPCTAQCAGICGPTGCFYCYDDKNDPTTYNETLSTACGQCCFPAVQGCGSASDITQTSTRESNENEVELRVGASERALLNENTEMMANNHKDKKKAKKAKKEQKKEDREKARGDCMDKCNGDFGCIQKKCP